MNFFAIALLKGIRTSIHKFESTRYKYASLQQAYQKYFVFRQIRLTNSDYLEGVQVYYQLTEDNGGTIGPVDDKNLIRGELRSIPLVDSNTKDKQEVYNSNAQQLVQEKEKIQDIFLLPDLF